MPNVQFAVTPCDHFPFAFNVNGLLSRRGNRSSKPITNVPAESTSPDVATNTKDAIDEFSRESAIGTGPGFTFARADANEGGSWRGFYLRSHVSKYRDPQRNLRNRRMTSFIDHVATINLI